MVTLTIFPTTCSLRESRYHVTKSCDDYVTNFSATNAENMEMNKVKNQVTGEYGPVADTARYYKVTLVH